MEFSLDNLRIRISEGMSQQDAISVMKHHGVSTIEAIKAVREIYSIGLGPAKQLVTSHDAYSDAVMTAEPFHDAILEAFRERADDGEA